MMKLSEYDYFIKLLDPPKNYFNFKDLNEKLYILDIELCTTCYLFIGDSNFYGN